MDITKTDKKRFFSWLGSRKSEKKARASRENGKLGGRPRKREVSMRMRTENSHRKAVLEKQGMD